MIEYARSMISDNDDDFVCMGGSEKIRFGNKYRWNYKEST